MRTPELSNPQADEREALANELLEVVAMLPFLERGRTLNPDMYPELVDFVLERIQTAKVGELQIVKELGKTRPYTDVLLNEIDNRIAQLKAGEEV